MKIQGQGHCQGQTQWSHPGGHIWCLELKTIHLLFVSWPSDHFWLRYSKYNISPWKIKVKIIAKVKPDDHIWGLEFYQHVCILFCGTQSIFGWDIMNFIFDLENSSSRLLPRSNLMVTFEAWGSIDMSAFCSVSLTVSVRYIANSIFDHQNSRSRSRPNFFQVIYRSRPEILTKMKEIQKVFQKLSHEQKSVDGGGGGLQTSTKTYRGDLI